MKRSFNYSFVSGSPAQANSPVSAHSFQQTATLAAQPPTSSIASRHLIKSPLFQAHTNFLNPTDLSSYTYQPLWYQSPIQAPYRPPLAGLGITLSPSGPEVGQGSIAAVSPVAFPLRLPTMTFSSDRTLPSLREMGFEDFGFSSASSSPCILRPFSSTVWPLSSNPVVVIADDASTAYSPCPGDEFTTHSPDTEGGELVQLIPNSDIDMADAFFSDLNNPISPLPLIKHRSSPTEPLIGLFADFNMREFSLGQRLPSIGINPAFLMDTDFNSHDDDIPDEDGNADAPTRHGSPEGFRLQDPSTDFGSDVVVRFTDADVDAIVSVLSDSMVEKGDVDARQSLMVRSNANTPILLPYSNDQGLPVPALPTRSGTIPPAPSPNLANLVHMKAPIYTSKSPVVTVPSPTPRAPLGDITSLVAANRNSVLNAHLGIDVEELKAKAEEFRKQNPGRDIDKNWLATFAGKLSEAGERLDEFRCYVKDCSQTNKRRDHILVHVGSHVEFRPFQCDFCEMKFLRKNECKRHMTSHGGIKPYTCNICAPEREKSFVRQDLLKRHIKVTHANGAIEYGRRRKRIKLEKEIETGNLITFVSPLVMRSSPTFDT